MILLEEQRKKNFQVACTEKASSSVLAVVDDGIVSTVNSKDSVVLSTMDQEELGGHPKTPISESNQSGPSVDTEKGWAPVRVGRKKGKKVS